MAVAIDAAKKSAEGCDNCLFFALPTKNSMFSQHKLYFVSTLDRLPPPFWTVAMNRKKKAYLLQARELGGWNGALKEAPLKLTTDAQLKDFAKAFLDLAVGRAIYLDDILPGEKNRIEKKMGKMPFSQLRIVRDKTRFRLQFFGKDVTGAVQLWDLIVEPTGHIVKADVREF